VEDEVRERAARYGAGRRRIIRQINLSLIEK